MTKELLEELGWKFDDFWNNRAFYSLSKESKFSIFEHDRWGLLNPFNKDFELIYCDLTDEEIKEYTDLVKSYENCMRHPKDNSLYAYLVAVEKLTEFVKKMKDRC
jgi:hypothetical protein